MILYKEQVEQGAIIAMWKIEESVEEFLTLLHHDAAIIKQVNHFGNEKRKLEFLATRVLLNTVLNQDKVIAYYKSGDPYLVDHSYYISIAHTGPYVAIILHPTCLVGIDVERIADKAIRVKHKFLSEKELSFVSELNQRVDITLLWAVKEALYKVLKCEVVDFITDLHIMPFEIYTSGVINAQETRTEEKRNYSLSYRIEPEYVCVWTIQTK